jgi:hypothetical protein
MRCRALNLIRMAEECVIEQSQPERKLMVGVLGSDCLRATDYRNSYKKDLS